MTLFCEQLPSTHLAEEFGTPLYVYSQSALTEAFENYQTAFAALSPLVCYAVKANGNLSIIKHFASLGSGFDIVSGGELARISLALQVVASQYTQVPTLIFDEVDTGIGGGVAEMVGKALRALGKKHQVLAVTHLPQVASCGENHWQVRKHSEGEQTVSEISVLNHHQRIEEIARMLGGEIITDTTRSHAAELLHLAAA